ncbi:LnmK family bifunctional acyltransferase/decarboxylase [Streptomyces sp. NPDC001941]|uniref:LnmK family bifunctional acyltransferase/decarboxylase n=1 Tax=Streptomyces sp. NPDC001941 TaxID=3154659 RepID=UPI00332A1509
MSLDTTAPHAPPVPVQPAARPYPHTGVTPSGPGGLRRSVVADPGMCGPLASFVARVGDWTWDAVGRAADLDVCGARGADGDPCYLSFHHLRLRTGGVGRDRAEPRRVTFGDRLDLRSRCYDAGRLSVLTSHRLAFATGADGADGTDGADRADGADGAVGDPDDETRAPHPGSLRVDVLNTWVTRGEHGGNAGLLRRPPVGYDRTLLPSRPDALDPTLDCRAARTALAFPDPARAHWPVAPGPAAAVDHEIDPVSDVNGAGLLYFATYVTLAERALYRQWRERGGSRGDFAARALCEARISYFGNADPDTVLRLVPVTRTDPAEPGYEKTDVTIRDVTDGRLLAVALFRHRFPPA